MSRIIVGIDGSAESAAALRWAFDHARPDDVIVATHGWQVPSMGALEAPIYNPAEIEVEARQLVKKEIADVLPDQDGPAVENVVVHGHAGRVVIDTAGDADYVVVGTRGRGGVKGALLGSVSTYVLRHAKCPVVVVPG